MARLHYIDNLRWMCILMVFPFHAAMVFCPGWYGYYVLSDEPSTIAHMLTVSIEPWIMALLFCIAGMSMKLALQKRSPRTFLKERVTKLLVPFFAGLVLICPVIAYYAMKFHTGYTGSFAGAFVYFFTSVNSLQDKNGVYGGFSVDHLWFILFLFIISVMALGVIFLGRRLADFHISPERVNLPALILLFIPVWVLNYAGVIAAGYSFLAYFAMFLIGYSLLSMDCVQDQLEKYWAGLLAAWIILTIGVMWIGGIMLGHSEVFWGTSPIYVVTGWTGVLALFGAGRHLLDRSTGFTTYMNAASYPVYILHNAILVAVAYYVVMLAIPQSLQFLAIVIFSMLLTFAGYEILRRIPGVRALFGIADPQKETG
jgi:glucans biosynthesis protein C